MDKISLPMVLEVIEAQEWGTTAPRIPESEAKARLAYVTAAKAVAMALTPGIEPIKFVTMWSRRKGQVGGRGPARREGGGPTWLMSLPDDEAPELVVWGGHVKGIHDPSNSKTNNMQPQPSTQSPQPIPLLAVVWQFLLDGVETHYKVSRCGVGARGRRGAGPARREVGWLTWASLIVKTASLNLFSGGRSTCRTSHRPTRPGPQTNTRQAPQQAPAKQPAPTSAKPAPSTLPSKSSLIPPSKNTPPQKGPYLEFMPSEESLDPAWHPEEVELMDTKTNYKVGGLGLN